MAEFPEHEMDKPGPRFTSLLTTNHEDVPKRNSHLEVVQSELELLLLSANVRLRSLSSEEKLLRDPDVDVKIRKHRAAKRFVPKRRQSKILEAAIEAKRKRAEMPTAVVLPPKPVESEEFWSLMTKGLTGPVQPECKKFLTDIIDTEIDKSVFQRPQRRSSRSVKDPIEEEYDLRKKSFDALNENLKKDAADMKQENITEDDLVMRKRLIKAGVYIEDENEVLTELTIAQEELRQIVTENKINATILYRLSRNHEKSQRTKHKLFEVDKEIIEMMQNEKYESEEFEAKMKLREKYTKSLEKYEKVKEQWINDEPKPANENQSDESCTSESESEDEIEKIADELRCYATGEQAKPSTSKAEPV